LLRRSGATAGFRRSHSNTVTSRTARVSWCEPEAALARKAPAHRLPALAKKKRAERAVSIEALKKELTERIRAARDNAQAAVDRDEEPTLLPRPQKQELARRANVQPHTVTRCFRDSPELRGLWDMAADVDAILKHTK
jgi:nitrogen fixation protein FixH